MSLTPYVYDGEDMLSAYRGPMPNGGITSRKNPGRTNRLQKSGLFCGQADACSHVFARWTNAS